MFEFLVEFRVFTILTKPKGLNIIKKYFSKGILAQLGEHLPYKQRVIGSSPIGPIFYANLADELNIIWRSSSVGESMRFIPAVSAVQIRPSLLWMCCD